MLQQERCPAVGPPVQQAVAMQHRDWHTIYMQAPALDLVSGGVRKLYVHRMTGTVQLQPPPLIQQPPGGCLCEEMVRAKPDVSVFNFELICGRPCTPCCDAVVISSQRQRHDQWDT